MMTMRDDDDKDGDGNNNKESCEEKRSITKCFRIPEQRGLHLPSVSIKPGENHTGQDLI